MGETEEDIRRMAGQRLPERVPPPDLAFKVACLKKPETYPEPPGRIEVVETHMSVVFLTDRHAFKLKKPVRYEFLDFSTLAARRHNCEEEWRLNQALAPGVYLGVVPLAIDPAGEPQLEGKGEVVEWLVKMRRLPSERMLDRLIRQQTLPEADLAPLARRLTEYYRACPAVAMTVAEYLHFFKHSIDTDRRVLAEPVFELPAETIDAVHAAQLAFLLDASLLEERVQQGRIVEGHGDLRPEHICLESQPLIFDRLEFNRRLRLVDPVDELAFLAMECERLGAGYVGAALFKVYEQASGDRPPSALLAFYQAVRASMRARLSILHTRELLPTAWGKWRVLAHDYLLLAQRYCRQL
jgi:aminoglycoside phosphotransferase family enzyme